MSEWPSLRRLETHVQGLDTVLHGGLLEGAIYLVAGDPGSGKTVLCNQLAFERAARGDDVVYVTMIGESNARLLSNLSTFSFFDASAVGRTLTYFQGHAFLQAQDLDGFLSMLQATVREKHPRLLIVDSLSALVDAVTEERAVKAFLRRLGTFTALLDCTLVLALPVHDVIPPEVATVSDGIFRLHRVHRGMRASRELEVLKLRGSSHLEGRHAFEIGSDGVVVHPRTEALATVSAPVARAERGRVPLGIPVLDEMLLGGLIAGSTTGVLGGPGTGKTLLGLHFLAEGARRGEPGMHFGFYETPTALLSKADGVGLPVREAVERELVRIVWQPSIEHGIDELAERILGGIREHGIRRLFVDGVDAFVEAAMHTDRLRRYFDALAGAIRGAGVTAILSGETRAFGFEPTQTFVPLSAAFENMILLRHRDERVRFSRSLAILKVRESAYDQTVRDLEIRPNEGIRLLPAATETGATP